MPENLNYEELFDDILKKYTSSWKLAKVKTKEFGALFELSYNVVLLNDISQKKFIDELRVRNGNLAIHLITIQEEDKSWTI